MFISRSRTMPCPSIHLNGVQLERTPHYKYLAVSISDNLSWVKHINYTCSKARRHLGYLFRTFSLHCTLQALIYLFRAQVCPILDYSCIVWDPYLNKHKLMLGKIQLFATHMASKKWHGQSETFNAQFNLSSICARCHYFKMLYFLKFTNGFSCPCLPILKFL